MSLPIIGPVTGAAAAGVAAALGAVQIGAILAAKPKLSYATGGIVPGSSYTGDLLSANVNSGEMVLTRDQQAKLFALINGNGQASTGQTIVLQVGTLIGDASSYRELNRQLSKYNTVETKRTGE